MISVPREKVAVLIVSHDRRMDLDTYQGLLECLPYYYAPLFWAGVSDVALARNHVFNRFVEKFTEFEWAMLIDSDIGFSKSDWELLWEGPEDVVCAEYSKKVIGEPPAHMGLGFTRVHRSVFERIKELRNEDGSERVPQFYHQGELYTSYCSTGANAEGRWVGEDKTFLFYAALTGATYRIETRTRLRHIGSFAYHYPQQIPDFTDVTGMGAN